MFTFRKNLLVFFMALPVLVLLSCACSLEKSIGDGGMISGQPCGAPCFLGVVPGQADEEQLQRTIDEHPELRPCTRIDHSDSGGFNGLICAHVSFAIRGGKVEGLSFVPDKKIRLQELMRKYGEPDRIIALYEGLPDTPEQSSVRLFYDEICMQVKTEVRDGLQYEVRGNALIAEIIYEGQEYCQEDKEIIDAAPWRGFGAYYAQLP